MTDYRTSELYASAGPSSTEQEVRAALSRVIDGLVEQLAELPGAIPQWDRLQIETEDVERESDWSFGDYASRSIRTYGGGPKAELPVMIPVIEGS